MGADQRPSALEGKPFIDLASGFDQAKDWFETRLIELGTDFDSIGWDDYDSSLELYAVPPDVRLSPEAQAFVRAECFFKVYLNHADGWTTIYDLGSGEFKPVRGWRRRKTDAGFELSYWPESWNIPQMLARKHGYTIVPDPLEVAA